MSKKTKHVVTVKFSISFRFMDWIPAYLFTISIRVRTFKNFQVYLKDMALVILVGACHVVVVRGNFLWTSTDKSREEKERRRGPKERSNML